jgi:hypothetical protein
MNSSLSDLKRFNCEELSKTSDYVSRMRYYVSRITSYEEKLKAFVLNQA